jgi:hypothetical protein
VIRPVRIGVAVSLTFGGAGHRGIAQVTASAGAFVAPTEHRLDAGFGVERSFGWTFGAEGTVRLRPWLDADLRVLGGTLAGDDRGVVDREIAELRAQARVRPLEWLAFTTGAAVRTYSSVIARQRLVLLSVGAEARVPFSGGTTTGAVRLAALPLVELDGLGDAETGFSVAAGMEYRWSRVEGALWYSLERSEWSATPQGARRIEQLSALTLVLRVRVLGRR